MYLKQTKQKNGRVSLSIVQGYRKDGKTKIRTIQGLGYLDELEKIYPNPIAHFKIECEQMNGEAAKEKETVFVEIHPAQKIDKRTVNRKNIGSAIALSYYNDLNVERTLRNHTRERKHTYDLNAVMRLLTVERLLCPGSKISDFNNKDHYFFRNDFSENDLYRSLDLLGEDRIRDALIASMNREIAKLHIRDTTRVFYDVTNYYFECDSEEGLKKRFVSKEHRPNPVVQMGLLQDREGIPISFRLFEGNTNDCLTMLPVLKDMKRDMALERIVVVADKALNTSTNIAASILDGNGYVFSQSIRNKKSADELRRWVLSDEGYHINDKETFKIKSRQDSKMIHVKNAEGKTEDIPVEVKVVAFWSEKYARRSRHLRAKTVEKALELIKRPAAYEKATHYGATRYLDNVSFDKDTGEIRGKDGKTIIFNEKKLAEEEACDGYYCIITSEIDLPDKEIVDIYRGLWKIEEAFKITKTDIESRPVYVSTDKHIRAHFLICYLALTILRLIQLDTDFEYSATSIIAEMCAMEGTHLQDNWWLFDHRSDLSDLLCKAVGIDLTKRNMQLKDIKHILTQVKKK